MIDLIQVVDVAIPSLTALTGFVSALAALVSSRHEVARINAQAVATGIPASPGATPAALELAVQLVAARAELARLSSPPAAPSASPAPPATP